MFLIFLPVSDILASIPYETGLFPTRFTVGFLFLRCNSCSERCQTPRKSPMVGT